MLVVDCIGNKILTIKTENAFSAGGFVYGRKSKH